MRLHRFVRHARRIGHDLAAKLPPVLSSDATTRNELSALIANRDWTNTVIGPADAWPASLRTVLRIMLSSRYAMWLGWGKELTFFYNDEYAAQTLGGKHPWALGQPAAVVWAEIWDAVGPRIEHVLRTGEATWDEGLLLFLERNGYPEETYHTFSYSAAPGDDGSTGGLFCVVIEQTKQVIGERHIRLLHELGAALATTKTVQDVHRAQERILDEHVIDFPFSLTYLVHDGVAHCCARSVIAPSHPAVPERIALGTDADPWSIAEIIAKNEPAIIDLAAGTSWPPSKWGREPAKAIVVPLAQIGGVFIAALNPYRPVDDDARSFAELFANQLAAGISTGRAFEEEKRRAEQLAELDRAKTAFFSNVSHEFRTPLTLMLGPTEDALASPERTLRGAELEVVHRNELRLLKLVNTLLDFSRAEAGRVQAAYQETELGALTRDLASAFRSAIERAGLVYDVDIPVLDEPIWVDHDMWEKIVLNLLSNALKFTLQGGIRIGLRLGADAAVLDVADTGAGIPESELPRMFERFHRIEGVAARTHEGSGIGLALVRDLVKLHGGDIQVASKEGSGTTFTVTLPRGRSHLPHDHIATPRKSGSKQMTVFVTEALRWLPDAEETADSAALSEPPPSTIPTEPRAHVLVADDNADMREYVARLLREHWVVTTVSDGAEAQAALERIPYDLVVSDVMMPRVDGFELLRHMKSEPRLATIPVVLLSARAGEEAIADGLRAGADDYLVKPFAAATLLVRIEAQLAAARSRAALRKQIDGERQRLQEMFEVSPSAICLLRGVDLVIELANPNMLGFWGKSPEVVGKPFTEALPEMVDQPFPKMLRDVITTGAPFVGKAMRARLDRDRTGEPRDFYFDFTFAPVRDGDGTIGGVFVHAFDVTELVSERRAAERANRMKDEFLATMSHELRTPLNAILGWASLLRSREYDAPARGKALETIERNAKSQARLIDDVLDVSRIVSGKMRLKLERVDVGHVIAAAVDVIRPAADAKRIRLEVRVPTAEALDVNGDADRLQQVIWNFLANSVRFTPADGTIVVDARRVDSTLRIFVRDTGSGIPAEHLPHVFERFRQVDSSTTRHHGGLGLGLAIVRHIVEMHGGTVTVESDGPNKGATFTVVLPIRAVLQTESDARTTTGSYAPIAGALRADLRRVRVLVADDDADSRDVVANALVVAGADVTAVDSARAAFDALGRGNFDILVSDIGMPGEDGYSLIRRVREGSLGESLPAVALTAYARPEDEALALDAGFNRHLAKPVDPGRLAATVAELTASSDRGGRAS